MFNLLGRWATKHPWKICALWLLVALITQALAPEWESSAQDDDIRYLPGRCDSVRGYHLLEKAFPKDVYASRAVFAFERAEAPLTPADLALVDRVVDELQVLREAEPGLKFGNVYSHRDPYIGKRLMSKDGHCTLVQVALGSPYLAVNTRTAVDRAEARVRPLLEGADAPAMYITGPAGVGRDLISASADSLDHTTIATIILIIVILLMVYRSPLLALIPLLTIALCVWVALNLLSLCTLIPGFTLVNVSRVFAIVMIYGAGTDYCLFLVSRFREELTGGHEMGSALRRGLRKVGGALSASAGTTICGLGLMALAEHAKIRSGGPAIALGLAVALLGSLTLAPALLRIFGKKLFWPFGMPVKTRAAVREQGIWNRLSKAVMKRPALIWAASVLVLLPLAILGSNVQPSYRATGELSQGSGSVRGLAAVHRHFTDGETGPLTILLSSKTDWDSEPGRDLIRHLSQGFARLENVAEVRSLTQPLGEAEPITPTVKEKPPEPKDKLKAFMGFLKSVKKNVTQFVENRAEDVAKKHYVAKLGEEEPTYVTRLDVVLHTDPFAPESVPTLETLQYWLREEMPKSADPALRGLSSEVYGITVSARDLAQVTESDRKKINLLVLIGIFLILLILVRKPWLAAYLLITVLFSYLATLGATTMMATWFHGRPWGEVDWRVPFFLFVILIAVGVDYNILLITRALKEKERYGPTEGMRRALARTGGTITSCGVIMAVTFATLMLSGLGTLIQIGFALAVGVLLDTFVVRPFLVPALAILVWRQREPEPLEDRPTILSLPRSSEPKSRRAA